MPIELPILIPLLTAILMLLVRRHHGLQHWVGILGALGLLTAGVVLLVDVLREGMRTTQIGDWPAPFGITLVADHLSALFVVMTGIVGTTVAIYARINISREQVRFAWFPLLHLMLMGITAAFLTGDLFNLYVWFEVLLTASFVLIALGGERPQMEGALKYVLINLLASFLFLTAVGLLYGAVGTLNMAHIAETLSGVQDPSLVTTVAMLLLVAFGIKAAAFPLFFWLPSSYHVPAVAVSAVFAGLLTKVGIYALLRVFNLLFASRSDVFGPILLIAAALTILTGMLGAIVQHDIRRVLSFSLVGHIGYMLLGLGLFTARGLAGAVYYAVHEMVVITALFLASGIISALGGSSELHQLHGLYRRAPGLSILFGVLALSLAGIPPLSGFVGKLILIQATLAAEHYLLALIAVIGALLTIYAMARVWVEAFWDEPEEAGNQTSHEMPGRYNFTRPQRWFLYGPTAVLAIMTITIGLGAAPLFDVCQSAAEELLHAEDYIQNVLATRDEAESPILAVADPGPVIPEILP